MSTDLKTQVRVALALRNKSQKWLASEIGIHDSQLSDIINGKRHGNRTTIYINLIKRKLGIEDEHSKEA